MFNTVEEIRQEASKVLEIAINMTKMKDDGLLKFLEEQKDRFDNIKNDV